MLKDKVSEMEEDLEQLKGDKAWEGEDEGIARCLILEGDFQGGEEKGFYPPEGEGGARCQDGLRGQES